MAANRFHESKNQVMDVDIYKATESRTQWGSR